MYAYVCTYVHTNMYIYIYMIVIDCVWTIYILCMSLYVYIYDHIWVIYVCIQNCFWLLVDYNSFLAKKTCSPGLSHHEYGTKHWSHSGLLYGSHMNHWYWLSWKWFLWGLPGNGCESSMPGWITSVCQFLISGGVKVLAFQPRESGSILLQYIPAITTVCWLGYLLFLGSPHIWSLLIWSHVYM